MLSLCYQSYDKSLVLCILNIFFSTSILCRNSIGTFDPASLLHLQKVTKKELYDKLKIVNWYRTCISNIIDNLNTTNIFYVLFILVKMGGFFMFSSVEGIRSFTIITALLKPMAKNLYYYYYYSSLSRPLATI